PPKSQCINCLNTGHLSATCPKPQLCPYCGDEHHAHSCKEKQMTHTKCTSCSCEAQRADPLLKLTHPISSTHCSASYAPNKLHKSRC
ncbi:hypothetical protein CROQUDRAFT_53015, partial [Cronartium quercuum f. sp. fusiforme G11]